jgi:hypothetical protein
VVALVARATLPLGCKPFLAEASPSLHATHFLLELLVLGGEVLGAFAAEVYMHSQDPGHPRGSGWQLTGRC